MGNNWGEYTTVATEAKSVEWRVLLKSQGDVCGGGQYSAHKSDSLGVEVVPQSGNP